MSKSGSSQVVFTFLAVGISMAALFVSIQQSTIMKEQTELLVQQTKAQAWPHLDMELYRGFGWIKDKGRSIDKFKITFQNKGTGPAIIEGLKIIYDDKAFSTWRDLYKYSGLPDSIPIAHSNSPLLNKVIAANEEIELISYPQNNLLREWMYEKGDNITIQICYRSVFDEYWISERKGFKSNTESTLKTKVEACNMAPEDLFID